MTQTVASLSPASFGARLAADGIGVRIGPFDFHLRARVRGLAAPMHRLYGDYRLLDGDRVFSAHATLDETARWLPARARRVRFRVDGRSPHADMPAAQSLAVLEWGLNLVVALRFQCFLMLHAAALERQGRALLLPASPGHGKTTLCAALAHRGWRLLSDEFGLLRPGSLEVLPLPRPMSLKNESIAVLRAFAPDAELGPSIPGTIKGTVAHVRAPASSVARDTETASIGWVVFPRWVAGAAVCIESIDPAEAFMSIATNAFNYEVLGETAFDSVRRITTQARCFRLVYSDLAQAIEAIDALLD